MKKTIISFMFLLLASFMFLSNVKAESNYSLVSIDELPETSANFFDLNGKMGTSSFETELNKVTIKVTYESLDYYFEMFMGKETDMSIFSEYQEAFYYTADNEKFIVINTGDYSFFDKNGDPTEVFNSHLIWNLNKNEYEKIERFQTYLYTELEDSNNAYAYFYVDEFMIDNLLSATLRYRYKYINLFGKPSANWEEVGVILEDEAYAETEKLSWQVKYMTATYLASQALMFVPSMQLPSLIIGTSLLIGINELKQGTGINMKNVKQIDKIVPNDKIINKLDSAYYNVDPNFDGINQGYNIFKLHLGQFNKALTTGIEFDKEYNAVGSQKGINVIEFTYMTNGEIYTQKGGNINIHWQAGTGTDGKGANLSIGKNLVMFISFGILVLISIYGIRSGAFNNPKTLLTFIITLLMFSSFIYVVYWLMTSNILIYLINMSLLL